MRLSPKSSPPLNGNHVEDDLIDLDEDGLPISYREPYGAHPSKEVYEHTYILCERCRQSKSLRRVTFSVGVLTRLYANICEDCVKDIEAEIIMVANFMRRVQVDWSEVSS